jgi:hypothetical protein
MRKLTAVLGVGLLTLAMAVPAAAAPRDVPPVGYWEIDCPCMDPFTVGAVGVPGWEVGVKGEPPWHFRSGTFYVYEEGVVVAGPFTVSPPPGLADKLDVGPCYMHIAGGDISTFDVVVPDAYYILPADR